MEVFAHIKTVLSIILSLGIGTLLNGVARSIQHPKRTKPYWVHLLFVFYLFLAIIHLWWWEYNLRGVSVWNFTEYLFLISYIMLYFFVCQLVYPSDLKDYDDDYRTYFFRRKKWFFLVLVLILCIDVGDTLLKGSEYLDKLMPVYAIRILTSIGVSLFLAFSKSRSSYVYAGGLIFLILFELYIIITRYYVNV